MPLLGDAVIAIWNDIKEEGRANFHEWHPREHMPERLSIPGFLRGRRYVSDSADIEFYTLYEAASLDTVTGPDYKARLDSPTPWSKKSVMDFGTNLRGICRVALTRGHADGAFLTTIRFAAAPGREGELEGWLTGSALPPLLEEPRICGVHLAITDHGRSGTKTRLQSARTIGVPDWVVMIEGGSAAAVEAAAMTLTEAALCAHGAAPGIVSGSYQLEYGITGRGGGAA